MPRFTPTKILNSVIKAAINGLFIGITMPLCMLMLGSAGAVFVAPFVSTLTAVSAISWGLGSLGAAVLAVLGGGRLYFGESRVPNKFFFGAFNAIGFTAASLLSYFLPLQMGLPLAFVLKANALVSGGWFFGSQLVRSLSGPRPIPPVPRAPQRAEPPQQDPQDDPADEPEQHPNPRPRAGAQPPRPSFSPAFEKHMRAQQQQASQEPLERGQPQESLSSSPSRRPPRPRQ